MPIDWYLTTSSDPPSSVAVHTIPLNNEKLLLDFSVFCSVCNICLSLFSLLQRVVGRLYKKIMLQYQTQWKEM
jgi:hypothetical protein